MRGRGGCEAGLGWEAGLGGVGCVRPFRKTGGRTQARSSGMKQGSETKTNQMFAHIPKNATFDFSTSHDYSEIQ